VGVEVGVGVGILGFIVSGKKEGEVWEVGGRGGKRCPRKNLESRVEIF
jgi:hypothetical protein